MHSIKQPEAGRSSPDVPHPRRPFLDTHLLVVVSANLTFKTTTTEALMWVTDLQSGEPMADVPLTVYDDNFQVIGQGSSDADGLLKLDVPVRENLEEAR